MRTETRVDDEGGRTVDTYDEHERLVRTTDYDALDNLLSDTQWSFDAAGACTGWEVYGDSGKLFRRFARQRDEAGRMSTHEFGPDGALLRISFDD